MDFFDFGFRVLRAHRFAGHAHRNQLRKYTGEPYVRHCEEVANIVSGLFDDPDLVCAALLHDTVEDTETTEEDLRREFGDRITHLVLGVTDVSRPEHGNRKARKALDRDHVASGCAEVQNLKLADSVSNSADILVNDPNFAKTYIPEKKDLFSVLTRANPGFLSFAQAQVDLHLASLKGGKG